LQRSRHALSSRQCCELVACRFVAYIEYVDCSRCPEHVLPFVAGDVEERTFCVQTYSARQAFLVDYWDVSEFLECGVKRHDSPVAHVDNEDAAMVWIDTEVTGIV